MQRISKENYYLNIAQTVLERATCLRRVYGAIIVKNDEIISTGYNGAPRGRRNCVDMGYCTRERLQVPRGERYELCRSVHAEANAIISASRDKTMGATMYLAGRDAKTGAPCGGPFSGREDMPDIHDGLAKAVAAAEEDLGGQPRRLHYLSVPPKAALAVLSRYDGWGFVLVWAACVAVLAWRRWGSPPMIRPRKHSSAASRRQSPRSTRSRLDTRSRPGWPAALPQSRPASP